MHIGGEIITHLGVIPITNTLLTVFLIDLVLITSALILRKQISYIPSRFQSFFESIIDFIKSLMAGLIPHKYEHVVLPWLATFFIFIILNNWIGLFPGMETIHLKTETHDHHTTIQENENTKELDSESHQSVGTVEHVAEHNAEHNYEHEEKALFKGANSDLNVTAALAVVSFLFIHLVTIYLKGIKGWFNHYFHIKGMAFYMVVFFVIIGLLEIVLDPLKYISLALRLFGNILAGEVLVSNMSMIPLVALPFLLLEVLVGFLQALIFTGLTTAFLGSMIGDNGEHH